jgi:hypothetical protein
LGLGKGYISPKFAYLFVLPRGNPLTSDVQFRHMAHTRRILATIMFVYLAFPRRLIHDVKLPDHDIDILTKDQGRLEHTYLLRTTFVPTAHRAQVQ